MEKKTAAENISVTLDLPRPLFRKIEQEARDAERPRAWVIRKLLLQALESQEKMA